jgi:hypothetical protein
MALVCRDEPDMPIPSGWTVRDGNVAYRAIGPGNGEQEAANGKVGPFRCRLGAPAVTLHSLYNLLESLKKLLIGR